MANWYGMARSSYVRVKDPEAFKKYVEMFPATCITERNPETGEVLYGWYSDDENGNIPMAWFQEEELEELEKLIPHLFEEEAIDQDHSILDYIHHFFEENEVMIVLEAGSEKARYVTGSGIAINHEGKHSAIELYSSLIKQAKEDGLLTDKSHYTPAEY